jgi:hypothetical protein
MQKNFVIDPERLASVASLNEILRGAAAQTAGVRA